MRDLIALLVFAGAATAEDLQRSASSALALAPTALVIVVDGIDPAPARALEAAGSSVPVHVLDAGAEVGRAAALNAAMDCLADDVLVVLLGAGDTFFPDAKRRQIEDLGDREYASFSGHHARETGATWLPNVSLDLGAPEHEIRAMWERSLYLDQQFSASTTVFSHRAWREVGGFDESLRFGVDWDFAIRVHHLVSWIAFPDVTGEVLARPEAEDLAGRSGSARARRKRHAEDLARVHETARALSHPDLYAWWHRQRGARLVR